MGLCKCPKRKVTTQFCYEHRVNVCEFCVVQNHPRCIVQSYLLWLQDSEYSPICVLCNKELIQDECVRLCCYHVYHWTCLDKYVQSLPDTTAPAGYKCMQCNESVIPKPLLVSPVAEALREKLSSVNWGRIGLGMPSSGDGDMTSLRNSLSSSSETEIPHPIENVIVHIEENSLRPEESAQVPRRNPQSTNIDKAPIDEDDEENKYKRREPLSFAYGTSLWFRITDFRSSYSPLVLPCWKKTLLFFFLFILFCLVLKLLASYLAYDDPSFDVLADPNVHVAN